MRTLGARFGKRLAATAVACGILWIAAALPVGAESPSPAPETTLSADETSTIAAFIQRGIAEAPTDFINVRGHQNAFYNWDATVSFGPAFDHCSVHHDTDTRNWGLQCQSIDHAISSKVLSAALESAVNASLPSGFRFARARSNSEPDMEWTGPKLSVWVIVGDSADKSSYAITLDHDLRAKWWEFWKH
jgi:hypothetical protein